MFGYLIAWIVYLATAVVLLREIGRASCRERV